MNMENIEYLTLFFKKHNLSGEIRVRYDGVDEPDDDFMTDIIFENGDVININDIIFDIDSELSEDIIWQWLEYKKTNEISLMDWLISPETNYIPNIDDDDPEIKKEIIDIVEDIKNNINFVFDSGKELMKKEKGVE